jgi:uncharacterized Zn finger protein
MWLKPSRPREAKGGIKARSGRGQIGATWWSRRWIEVLNSFGWANRLQRGRSYARRGQVLDFELAAGRVTARVQGSRPEPYEVSIKLKALTAAQWNGVTAAMSAQAAFAAKLLSGTVPPEAEDLFRRARVPFFPVSRRDFDADCSCPDWAEVCKHIAAVHYLLAEHFDRDPFMLFELRGRTRRQILEALGKARGGRVRGSPGEPPPAPEPLRAEGFWELGAGFGQVRAAPAPPEVAWAVLRRLGEPVFAQDRPERWRRLREVYQAAGARALAWSQEEARESPSGVRDAANIPVRPS